MRNMAKNNELNPEWVMTNIKTKKIEFIDLQFTDLPGKLHHVTVPASNLTIDDFIEGVPHLDGSSIRGFAEIHESDMLIKPDPKTLAILPWIPEESKTARLLCDIYKGFGEGRLNKDPRFIAQIAENILKKEGYDVSYWGPEVEFFVFDSVTSDTLAPYQRQGYEIKSREAAWNSEATGYPIRFKEGYLPTPPQDTLMNYRSECVQVLDRFFDIACEAHHHEVATAGQCEIDLKYDSLNKMADNVTTYKYVVKNIAYNQGMIATMMPKPIFGDNGSGMHISTSIWKKGKNLFYDGEDEHAEISQLARYFGGGLIEHAQSLVAITNPIPNSYKRLVPGYEAPVYIAWSRRNRSAAIRVPAYRKGKKAANQKRIEFRPPDPAANPYLSFAAVLAAGLDGIKKKIDMGDPVDENIYKLSKREREQKGIKELPTNLKEASEALSSDNKYLKQIFPNEVIEYLINNAYNEHNEISMRPHPYEFYRYLDV